MHHMKANPEYMLPSITWQNTKKMKSKLMTIDNVVLPLHPALELLFTGETATYTKPCAVYDVDFAPVGRPVYCGAKCQAEGPRRKEREKKKKQRQNRGLNVPF